MADFTDLSVFGFLIQSILALVISIYLYLKYKNSWYDFEIMFWMFFVSISISSVVGMIFIKSDGLAFEMTNAVSFSILVFLFLTSFILLGVKNLMIYIYAIAVYAIDLFNDLHTFFISSVYAESIQTNIARLTSLLLIIPSVIIFLYLFYKSRDFSLIFFILGLLAYTVGGISSAFSEIAFVVLFIIAIVLFAGAVLYPILTNSNRPGASSENPSAT